jgi:hypothetical protein
VVAVRWVVAEVGPEEAAEVGRWEAEEDVRWVAAAASTARLRCRVPPIVVRRRSIDPAEVKSPTIDPVMAICPRPVAARRAPATVLTLAASRTCQVAVERVPVREVALVLALVASVDRTWVLCRRAAHSPRRVTCKTSSISQLAAQLPAVADRRHARATQAQILPPGRPARWPAARRRSF